MKFVQIVPNWGTIVPTFFIEPLHELPFISLVQSAVEQHCKTNKYEIQPMHSIFYATPQDFKSYLVFRATNQRSIFSAPDLDHMSDSSFNFQRWKQWWDSENL